MLLKPFLPGKSVALRTVPILLFKRKKLIAALPYLFTRGEDNRLDFFKMWPHRITWYYDEWTITSNDTYILLTLKSLESLLK